MFAKTLLAAVSRGNGLSEQRLDLQIDRYRAANFASWTSGYVKGCRTPARASLFRGSGLA
jgi:hypothetical protein